MLWSDLPHIQNVTHVAQVIVWVYCKLHLDHRYIDLIKPHRQFQSQSSSMHNPKALGHQEKCMNFYQLDCNEGVPF